MPALATREDDWTPARLKDHQAWRAKMYAPHKPVPKPDPLAAKLEIVADPERAALECKMRELEEELGKVRSKLQVAKKYVDFEEIDDLPPSRIMIAQIIGVCAKYFEVSIIDLKSHRRKMPLVLYRQIAMYLCKELTLRSLPDIARRFGNRDHTTALHAVRKISALVLDDPELCQDVAELVEILTAGKIQGS